MPRQASGRPPEISVRRARWSRGLLDSCPRPLVFKRNDRLLVKSFVIFAESLAPGHVETRFAPLLLGSVKRRGFENRLWKLAVGGEEAAGEPAGEGPPRAQAPRAAGRVWPARSRLCEVGSLSAAGGREPGAGSTHSGKSTCPHLDTARPAFTCKVSAPRLEV